MVLHTYKGDGVGVILLQALKKIVDDCCKTFEDPKCELNKAKLVIAAIECKSLPCFGRNKKKF